MIIGAQKSGTTTLAHQLANHPKVSFCRTKEPAFFNKALDWEAALPRYHGLYSPREGELCGEASTMYTFLPEHQGTHSRLFAYNPRLKLIYIMRQPVERIVSHYSHRIGRVQNLAPIETAVFDHSEYIDRSRYAFQIKPYIELFGRQNVLLEIFEDYVSDPLKTLERIAAFLGISIEGLEDIDLSAKNESVGRRYLTRPGLTLFRSRSLRKAFRTVVPGPLKKTLARPFVKRLEEKPRLPMELKRKLWQSLQDDVREMEVILGRPLSAWRKGYT